MEDNGPICKGKCKYSKTIKVCPFCKISYDGKNKVSMINLQEWFALKERSKKHLRIATMFHDVDKEILKETLANDWFKDILRCKACKKSIDIYHKCLKGI